jgi:hypothetical protein
MADPVIDPKVDPPAEPRGTDPSAVPDPRDVRLAELEEYAARAQATFEQLKPIEADIEALVKDEGYREFTRTSRESYYDMQKRIAKEKEDEIPEGEKRLLGEIDKRLGQFKPVLDDYDARTKAQEAAAKEASQEFAKRETEFAQRLVAEQKLSPEEVAELGAYAMSLHKQSVEAGSPRFVGIEEVYKRVYGRAEAKVAAPTPKSLRAKAGATGVPGASKPPETTRDDLSKPGGVTRHMLGVLNAQRKTG